MLSSDRESDAELLAAARTDPEAFGRFYDRYEAAVAGYFLRRSENPEVAADLTAEVFANALSAASRYRAEGLPAEQRDAIRARVLDERDYGEIARELRTSELVIRKRVMSRPVENWTTHAG